MTAGASEQPVRDRGAMSLSATAGRPKSGAKLAARVARQIESDVIEAGWPVGQLFGSESELMERYGVGRAVVREAVRIVEHHKVASMRRGPSGGLIVQAPDATPSASALMIYLAHAQTTIPDLIHARLLLEPMTAGMAARAITDEGIARLREALEHEATAGSQPGIDVQDEFHVLLGSLSGNPALALFVEVLTMLTRHYAAERPPTEAANRRAKVASQRAHRAIVDATIAGDAALAENRVTKHLRALGAWLRDGPGQRRIANSLEPTGAGGAASNKLAEIVADRIRLDIGRDNLAEGELVASEQELLTRYGISRAVLREAIRLLEYHSVVVMRRGPDGGLFVTRRDPNASIEAVAIYLDYQGIDFESLRAVRDVIELGLIELVVARLDENGVAERLRAALRVDANTPRDRLDELSHEFHLELAELAGNPVLRLFLQILTTLSARHMTSAPGSGKTPSHESMAREVDRVHRGIAEAIIAGDTAVAKYRMRRHLEALTTEWWH